MKTAILFSTSLFFFLCSIYSIAFCDIEGEAISHASVTVIPSISVGSNPSGAQMGEIQTGHFSGTFIFRIESNVQDILIKISASKLYKAGLPGEIEPIPLADNMGVLVHPDVSLPQTAAFETTTTINALPGSEFEWLSFESNQDSRFSSDIEVTVTWDQNDPVKPEGNYLGYVKLYTILSF